MGLHRIRVSAGSFFGDECGKTGKKHGDKGGEYPAIHVCSLGLKVSGSAMQAQQSLFYIGSGCADIHPHKPAALFAEHCAGA